MHILRETAEIAEERTPAAGGRDDSRLACGSERPQLVAGDARAGLHFGIRYPANSAGRQLQLVLGRPEDDAGPSQDVYVELPGSTFRVELTFAPGDVKAVTIPVGCDAGECLVRAAGGGGPCYIRCYQATLQTDDLQLVNAGRLPPGNFGRDIGLAMMNACVNGLNAQGAELLRLALETIRASPAVELVVPTLASVPLVAPPRVVLLTEAVSLSPYDSAERDLVTLCGYLEGRGFLVAAVPVPATASNDRLPPELADSGALQAVVVTGGREPRLLEGIRRMNPVVRLLYRCTARSAFGASDAKRMRNQDLLSARVADLVLAPDEATAAWLMTQGLPPGRVAVVPYAPPDAPSRIVVEPDLRRRTCLAVVIPHDDGTFDGASVFALGEAVTRAGWEFALSVPAHLHRRVLELAAQSPAGHSLRVEVQGQDPFGELREVPATVLLADSLERARCAMIDAIDAQCRVILPRALHRELAPDLGRYCLALDTISDRAVAAVLGSVPASGTAAWPEPRLVAALRRRAFVGLDAALGLNDALPRIGRALRQPRRHSLNGEERWSDA